MNLLSITKVQSKIKNLPDSLLKELEEYVDFLLYKLEKQNLNEIEVEEWQKNIVLERLETMETSEDAFEMLKDFQKK